MLNSLAGRSGGMLAGAAGALILVGGTASWLLAGGSGQLHWSSAVAVQAFVLAGLLASAVVVFRRQEERGRARRESIEARIDGLRADAGQIRGLVVDATDKLMTSFREIEHVSRQQHDWVVGIVGQRREPVDESGESADGRPNTAESESAGAVEVLAAMKSDLGGHVNSAVTSLQFHDLTLQLLDRMALHLDAMQAAVCSEPAVAAGGDVGTSRPATVTQSDMSAGEVELFR